MHMVFVVIFFVYTTCVPDVLSTSSFCCFAWRFQNRPQFWNSSVAYFSFFWKDVFDLENTKTLPYFLCIGAKLEVGSKMGYLLTSGRDTHHSRLLTAEKWQPGWCRWGQVHVPNLCASLCHRGQEWQEDKEICGLSLKQSPDRVHTLLRNQFMYMRVFYTCTGVFMPT